MLKSRVEICQLAADLYPGIKFTKSAGHKKKCNCVFHTEKTPSLCFDSNLNLYHCFGCGKGGDIFTLVQEAKGYGFVESAKWLVGQYCQDIDPNELDQKPEAEDQEEQQHKETLYIYNQYVQEFFLQQYMSDTPEAQLCRCYAEKRSTIGIKDRGRWEQEYCSMIGLGFSPKEGNPLVKYAKKKGLSLEILEELGLVKQREDKPGTYYDFFRNRLTIPQRDKYGRIVTFTARALDPTDSIKYLNGRNTAIYSKSESVFGVDIAMKAARATGKIYLLEGAPDVMRLQSLGIANAAATLGARWTEGQLSTFKSFSPTLCFIPDSDIPKKEEKYGVGIKAVIENGKLASRMGFRVTVREIPNETTQKQDADSYVTSKEKWDTLCETDFPLWLASKIYDIAATRDEQMRMIDEICDVLICIQDTTLQNSLLSDLKLKYKQAQIWKYAMNQAARRKQEEKRSLAIKDSVDELADYNFYRHGRHYYGIDEQGREKDWTNFIIHPLFLIADEKSPTRIFELENESMVRKIVELKQCDVTKLDKFKEKIEGKGNFRFFERPEKYEQLKAFMYEKTEEAVRVRQMGWNNIGEKGFYAFCNGVVYEGEWKPIDEYGIIRLEKENFYLPALSKMHKNNRSEYANERRFMHSPIKTVTRQEYFNQIIKIYGEIGTVCICFYLATLFRDIIKSSTRSFPLLNLYGKRGTGKTELAITLTSLFQRDNEISNIESTTPYAMGEKCAQVSNGLVHFDEYKNSLSITKLDFIKGLYDNAGRNKRATDSEHRENTSVDCGVILTGQELPTADSALFSRVLFMEMTRSERTEEESRMFRELLTMRSMYPTNITVELLRYRENFEAGWNTAWQKAIRTIKNALTAGNIQERIINNWAMMLATIYSLETFVELPFTSLQVRAIAIKNINQQDSLCNSTDDLATFWSLFSKARQAGEIIENQDYKIDHRIRLTVNEKRRPNETLEYGPKGKDILFIRKDICLAKISMQAKKEGKTTIPEDSMLSYIMSTPEYEGKTKSPLKFIAYDRNGEPIRKAIYDSKGTIESYEMLYDQERVLAFDYDLLCRNYDIDLRRQTITSKTERLQDEDEFIIQKAI